MTIEDVLKNETFKEVDYSTKRRVWDTVGSEQANCTKLLGLLIEHLQEKGLITEPELDLLLLRLVRGSEIEMSALTPES